MLILPLIASRLIEVSIGAIDTVMVASISEDAVSGVALVDTINNLVLLVISALAVGGATVLSQYQGRGSGNTNTAARQLLYIIVLITVLLAALFVLFRSQILAILFGDIEQSVMEYSGIYFLVTSLSLPFAGVMHSLAAIYLSAGNSKVPLLASVLMFALNLAGNALLIYGLGLGVAGAALGTMCSRMAAALMLLYLIRSHRNAIRVYPIFTRELHPQMIKRILRIGVPTGLENGFFQMGKLLVQSLISTFGTATIAANAIVNQALNFVMVPGMAISLGIIPVVGRCIGAGEHKQAAANVKLLMRSVYAATVILTLPLFLWCSQIFHIFRLGEETFNLCILLLRIATPFMLAIWPVAFPFSNVLRASGDVTYTMTVSMASMWVMRFGMSYALHAFFGLGILGVWYAMMGDWIVRGVLFFARYRSGKWRGKQVI